MQFTVTAAIPLQPAELDALKAYSQAAPAERRMTVSYPGPALVASRSSYGIIQKLAELRKEQGVAN